MNNKVEIKAEVHQQQQQQPMYEKINKQKLIVANEDERSSSGNWSAASSTCATATSSSTKSPTQNKDVVKCTKCTSCSAYSLSNEQQSRTAELCKKNNNSETNVISSVMSNENGLVQFRPNEQKMKIANRDSESWLQFFFENNESTDTITNEKINVNNLDTKKIREQQNKLQPNEAHQQQQQQQQQRNKFKLRTKPRNELDELLSIHSNDTGKRIAAFFN